VKIIDSAGFNKNEPKIYDSRKRKNIKMKLREYVLDKKRMTKKRTIR